MPENRENPIQYVRLAAGLSQVEFAARLGLSRSLVAKLESRQGSYRQASKRVRKLIAREFGAIIQPLGAVHPAIDFHQQPYTTSSFTKHQQGVREPLADDYPAEAIGKALTWVAEAAQNSAVAASFHEAISRSVSRLSNAGGLAKALDKAIRRKGDTLSTNDYIAATWLLQFFNLPQVSKRLPKFVGWGKDGQALFELTLTRAPRARKSPNSADQSPIPNPNGLPSPQEQR